MMIYEPKYVSPSLDDPFHIDRWMCSKCGLIFDYQFSLGPDEPGWSTTDPPVDKANFWIDEEGEYHFEDVEYKELCPRCNNQFEESPLIRITVIQLQDVDSLLPLIQKGEGITTEFKEKYPDNAHELGRDIAAFATTLGGKIFLGVDNCGVIKGYPGIENPTGKDQLQKRIRGQAGAIKPRIKVQVDFFSNNENLHLAVITIPKGNMPFYTINGKTYIRDLDESRPAEPEEITQLVKEEWEQRKYEAG